MSINLTDDGTMDTVLRCSDCGEEFRYNYTASEIENDDFAQATIQFLLDRLQWADADGRRKLDHAAKHLETAAYNLFVDECIEDATADHVCGEDDSEPSEPSEDDITTEDHRHFYMSGKLVLEPYRDSDEDPTLWLARLGSGQQVTITAATYQTALAAFMNKIQYWPNCWLISDHGNAHLMNLSEKA